MRTSLIHQVTGQRTAVPRDVATTRTTGRTPWTVWAFVLALLAAVVALDAVNPRAQEDAPVTVLFVAVVAAFTTVGALLASRVPQNRIGWLLLGAGITLVLSGAGDAYLASGARFGHLLTGLAGLLSNAAWGPLAGVLILIALYFPTGRVLGPRWRRVPVATAALIALALAGTVLSPGSVGSSGVRVPNPFGIEALAAVADAAQAIGYLGLLPAFSAAILSLVLRYRRSRGDERQQIRWLTALAGVVAALIVMMLVDSSFISPGGSRLGDFLFITLTAVVGLGLPSALAVAILRYRLYDLDLVIKKTVLYGTVAIVLTGLFVAVGLVFGTVVGKTQTGAVVAAAAMGLAFWPSVGLSRRVADRVVYGRRATPYEILADFSTRLAGSYAAEEVLDRMAGMLSSGIGARSAIVWLRVGDRLVAAAAAPGRGPLPGPLPVVAEGHQILQADASVDVRHDGELLGMLAVTMPADDPLTPAKERLVRDLASQAGLVLRNVRLIQELRASRQRLVTAQDEERRRLERNIHDGAQQQLVAISVRLGLIERSAERDPAKAAEMAGRLRVDAVRALEDLRDLARGIFPPVLADEGIGPALRSVAERSPLRVSVVADRSGRFAPEIESAVYFCCLEALQNVAKYARVEEARVTIAHEDGSVVFRVDDDGVGFDPASAEPGTGLRGMADRLEALGGTLQVLSSPGAGTSVRGRLPVPGTHG